MLLLPCAFRPWAEPRAHDLVVHGVAHEVLSSLGTVAPTAPQSLLLHPGFVIRAVGRAQSTVALLLRCALCPSPQRDALAATARSSSCSEARDALA
eukprot:3126855-Rhodomonas_salina.2